MQEKGLNSANFRPNSLWLTRIVTVGVFIGILILWSIDGCTIRDNIKLWQNKRDLKLYNPINLTNFYQNLTHIGQNLTHIDQIDQNLTPIDQNLTPIGQNLTAVYQNVTSDSSPLRKNPTQVAPVGSPYSTKESLNSTELELVSVSSVSSNAPEPQLNVSQSSAPQSPLTSPDWISVKLEENFTSNLISRWLAPGGEPCKDSETGQIAMPGLDDQNSVDLSAGEIHEFVINALDEGGNRRCLGGDYFEVDLSGETWKSRPPINDFNDGSYSLKLQVHPDFAGEYNLTIVLLFRHFQGLRYSPERFVYWRDLRRIRINFHKSMVQLPELQICGKSDFGRDLWSGRWTRHGKNDKCEIDYDGRYRCLKPTYPCQKPWCSGSLGSLESNGWVYSTHCSFQIFSAKLAWECLQNRWIFFWGDSNHVDSIRNLLNFVLGLSEIKAVPRRFDLNFTNPMNPSQSVRITSIFNGHWNETKNYEGLNSLQNEEYRDLLKRYFSEQTVPDTMIMNSGLHDGVHWKNIRRFANGAEYATRFWEEVIKSVKARGLEAPKLIYRTTIATGGYARSLAFNPNKMETFNEVMLEKLKNAGILSGVIDDFDMTFPWHYDNRCSDGVHYGRAPAKLKWRDGEIGHQYFVDLMLGHVLLNAICAR